jgi:NADH:ubiquinone oxidoreductase subunit 2 (subunit N)
MFAFAVGGVSIMGLPPSGGFMAKWTLLNAAILSEAWYFVVLMVVGGLLAAAYIFRVVKLSFVLIDAASTTNSHGPIARNNEWASLALACLALLLGLNALPLLDLAAIGLPEMRR